MVTKLVMFTGCLAVLAVAGSLVGAAETTYSWEEELPFVTMGSAKVNGSYISCNGIMLSDHHMLTTANCIPQTKDFEMKHYLVMSSDCITGDTTAIAAKKFIVHPDYKADSRTNNIAIVVLEEEMQDLEEDEIPIIMQTNPEAKDKLFMAGWENDGTGMAGTSAFVGYSLFSNNAEHTSCTDKVIAKVDGFKESRYMCVSLDASQKTSKAISASGLFGTRNGTAALYGLLSTTVEADNIKTPVLVRVAPYLPWIQKSTNLTLKALTGGDDELHDFAADSAAEILALAPSMLALTTAGVLAAWAAL
ncbi:hypothetical protein H4R34_001284 [Dimargaris verticillata]|uniref:Peptidase S1 domain-containing protein n=1 Tax=Dimargaris verticillata TaxID=2761393 RepID=A0A9W8B8S7_9FUNG|nr:hypothetical protein H4R34_001284 [Dimargaris verticillata]